MNAKIILGLAGIGAVGYLVYCYMKKDQTGSYAVTPYAVPSNNYNLGIQPSELYPFAPTVAPRVDNSSQPWYGGSRVFNQDASGKTPSLDVNFAQNVSYVGGAANIIDSLDSIWDSIGGFFDTEDTAVAAIGPVDSGSGGFDWSSMGGSDEVDYYNA